MLLGKEPTLRTIWRKLPKVLLRKLPGLIPFSSGEQMQIAELLTAAVEVKKSDRKLDQFLSQIVDPLYTERSKLLVFTEYRATQEYLVGALEAKYPTRKSLKSMEVCPLTRRGEYRPVQ